MPNTISAISEQQRGRELLAPAGRGEVESDDAHKRADEERDSGAPREITANVRAERHAADGQSDQPHDLAEDRGRAIPGGDWRLRRELRLFSRPHSAAPSRRRRTT